MLKNTCTIPPPPTHIVQAKKYIISFSLHNYCSHNRFFMVRFNFILKIF